MPPERKPTLLDVNDGPAVLVTNTHGKSPFVLVCEHASNRVPSALGRLGVEQSVLESHVAWDPGAFDVARSLSATLDAPLVSSGFSRLVMDVNRPAGSPESIREVSELFRIDGNVGLAAEQRAIRRRELYDPFHATISTILDQRDRQGIESALVTVHSFTPVYFGKPRSVEFGILHHSDARLADIALQLAPKHTSLVTRRNEPYGPEDGVTHTLGVHAIPRGLANVMLEIRNDLLRTRDDRERIAREIAGLLEDAYYSMTGAAATAGHHG